jgi:hypothetical protein
MGRSSRLFHPVSKALSSPLATTIPRATGRPIKRGLLGRKETPIVGHGESTWKMLKKMRLTQPQVASMIFAMI